MNLLKNRFPDMLWAPSTVAHLSSMQRNQAERIEALISLRGACVILVQWQHYSHLNLCCTNEESVPRVFSLHLQYGGILSGVETFLEVPNTAAHLGASASPVGLWNTLLSPSQVWGELTPETQAVFQRESAVRPRLCLRCSASWEWRSFR